MAPPLARLAKPNRCRRRPGDWARGSRQATSLRYSAGVLLVQRLKALRKLEASENPTRSAMSSILSPVLPSNSLASRLRESSITSWQLNPTPASLRRNVRGERLSRSANAPTVGGILQVTLFKHSCRMARTSAGSLPPSDWSIRSQRLAHIRSDKRLAPGQGSESFTASKRQSITSASNSTLH